MKRSKYQDGVEVHMEDLNNTEITKADAIKERQKSFTQPGVIEGLRVTPNTFTPSHIDIGVVGPGGICYCANGERIEILSAILDKQLVDETMDVYNFVTLVYTEVESDYKEHESDGNTYPTRVTESYTVSILTEANYGSLTDVEKENRVVVGIVRANGPGLALSQNRIQTSLELLPIITSTAIDIDGVWLLRFSDNTERGSASFKYTYSSEKREIQYMAPNDTDYGASVTLVGDGDYLLESNDTDYWCRIRIIVIMMPTASSTVSTNVTKLYEPPLEGSTELYPTPTATAVDRLHRTKIGTGLPTSNNPHGLTYDDLTGGFTDVTKHQDLMHANGIVSQTWEETGSSNCLACSINVGTVLVSQPGANEFYFVHGLGFSTIEGITSVVWAITDPAGTWFIALGTDQQLHKSLSAFDEDDYLVLCSVDVTVSGGNRLLGNLVDLRKFGTTATGNIQNKAITHKKIDDGAVRQKHLWAEGDDQTLEALVKGPNSNADHLHYHDVEDPRDLFYLKPLLYAPQSTEPDEVGSISGANLVGYKNPMLDKDGEDYGDLFPEDVKTIQKAIDQLAALMKTEMARECPKVQEVMHSGGRMLNLTFVPLPDNHLNGGFWKDGVTQVSEEQCSWIVSPAFVWGAAAAAVPWVFCCSTFGLGMGGDFQPTNDSAWTGDGNPANFTQAWANWLLLFNAILNGQVVWGRWLIMLVFVGTASGILSLFNVFGSHANYQITATNPKPIS